MGSWQGRAQARSALALCFHVLSLPTPYKAGRTRYSTSSSFPHAPPLPPFGPAGMSEEAAVVIPYSEIKCPKNTVCLISSMPLSQSSSNVHPVYIFSSPLVLTRYPSFSSSKNIPQVFPSPGTVLPSTCRPAISDPSDHRPFFKIHKAPPGISSCPSSRLARPLFG